MKVAWESYIRNKVRYIGCTVITEEVIFLLQIKVVPRTIRPYQDGLFFYF